MTGRLYNEALGRTAAILIFAGFNLTFFPQFFLGYSGMPRRYHEYAPEFQVLNVLSTAGASILAIGYVLPLLYLLWSTRNGAIAGNNPWDATGLEWQTTSPPPPENFDTPPVVNEPYQYEVTGEFTPQAPTEPPPGF
jgi:cytochrome c oxidase subunit 1